MFVKMKIKCFSKRKSNVRISKTKTKCAILGFSPNCCILGKSREKLVKFSKKLRNILANFATFCKNQQKIQQFWTKKLRLENGATPSWVLFFQTRKQPRALYRYLGTLSKGFASQEIRTKEIRLSDVISKLDQTEPLYCLRIPTIFACLSHGLYLDRARG